MEAEEAVERVADDSQLDPLSNAEGPIGLWAARLGFSGLPVTDFLWPTDTFLYLFIVDYSYK